MYVVIHMHAIIDPTYVWDLRQWQSPHTWEIGQFLLSIHGAREKAWYSDRQCFKDHLYATSPHYCWPYSQ